MNQKKHNLHPVGDKNFKEKYLSEEEIAENNTADEGQPSFMGRLFKKLKELFSSK